MSINNQEANHYINDPVPKNVSKFPIHQTYLTSDAEGTGNGGYKFKCPEVWSSARSGKKSIAIRSIERAKSYYEGALSFGILVKKYNGTTLQDNIAYRTSKVYGSETCISEILKDLSENFRAAFSSDSLKLIAKFENNTVKFKIHKPSDDTATYKINIVKYETPYNATTFEPSTTFNYFFNQPMNYISDFAEEITYENVWSRNILHFHASFIPFDNYQYLGSFNDKWNNPIIYQDPNTSPLFNIWTTSDLKTPIKILYEDFVFRFTFIISSESQYKS